MSAARTKWRAWWRALTALALAVVFVGGALLGGKVYGWCVAMERTMPSCCMHALREPGAKSKLPSAERFTFELRSVDRLPATTAPGQDSQEPIAREAQTIALAPVFALALPAADAARRRRAATEPTSANPGVGPPVRQSLREHLCVYRC